MGPCSWRERISKRENQETQHMSQMFADGVPFSLAGGANPLILVPTYVNEAGPYTFILDTGASQSLLSPELASILGIQPESDLEAVGAGGPVKISLARLNSISVGGARQERIQVGITHELERIATAIQAKVDGDLGFNFMKDFRVTLDYKRSILRLVPASQSRDGNGDHPVPIPFRLAAPSNPLVVVPAFVNGEGPFDFVLDTGASRTVFAPEIASRLGIQTGAEKAGTGAGGQVRMVPGKVNVLAVGDASVQDLAIVVGDFMNMISTAAEAKLDGIVGYNFLNRFHVTIDYPQNQLELTPVPQAN
jgi:predicted aspartyl protease